MKKKSKHSHSSNQPLVSNPSSKRLRKVAATVAALGAAIGVNMADVLAGSGSAQTKEIDRSAISSSKLNRPDVQSQKVKKGLTTRPSSVEGKEFRGLENRPESREEKIAPSQLKKRPDVSGFRGESSRPVERK